MAIRSMNIHIEHADMVAKFIILHSAPHWNPSILDNNIKLSILFFQLFNHLFCDCLDSIKFCHVQFYHFNFFGMRTQRFDSL